MLKYKGYAGVIDDINAETGWLSGCVIGIQDVITFEGKTAPELMQAFRESVDDYLEYCEKLAEAPEQPFSGKFVVRLSPDLHQKASEAARQADVSLNGWMVAAVEDRLQRLPQPRTTTAKLKPSSFRKNGKGSKRKASSRA